MRVSDTLVSKKLCLVVFCFYMKEKLFPSICKVNNLKCKHISRGKAHLPIKTPLAIWLEQIFSWCLSSMNYVKVSPWCLAFNKLNLSLPVHDHLLCFLLIFSFSSSVFYTTLSHLCLPSSLYPWRHISFSYICYLCICNFWFAML